MTAFNYHINEIDQVAQAISSQIKHRIIVFEGQMGAGKTTFIQALIKHLGFDAHASSPTFSLVNEYNHTNKIIYHFDLYRITSLQEALDFGFEEYIDSEHLCLIEWPENILLFLDDFHTIKIDILNENERKLMFL